MEVNASQIYPLGMRYAVDDKVYRYVQADSARQLRAAYSVFPDVTFAETGTVAATAAIGATVVSLTAVGTVVANEFDGGLMGVLGGGAVLNYGEQYRIRSNTAPVGGVFTVTLYDPLVAALTIGTDSVVLNHSVYRRVISQRQRQVDGVATDYRKSSPCGVPLRFVPLNYYCWIQTWGHCFMVGSSGTEGTANSERAMQIDDVGALIRLRDLGDGLGRHAYGGNIVPITTGGNQPSGLIAVMLMLSP